MTRFRFATFVVSALVLPPVVGAQAGASGGREKAAPAIAMQAASLGLDEVQLNDQLVQAAANNDLAQARRLLIQGANPNAAASNVNDSWTEKTPLVAAVWFQQHVTPMMRLLMRHQAAVNGRDRPWFNVTPLISVAATGGSAEVAGFLLAQGARLNDRDR